MPASTINMNTNFKLRTLGVAAVCLTAPLIITSCGEENTPKAANTGKIDPAKRKAAVAKLQEKGFKPTVEDFSRCLRGNCRAEVLQLFLDAGMQAKGLTGSGQTTLMMLIEHSTDAEEAVKCAQLLLQYGADVNTKDRTGKTALHYAVGRRNPQLVKVLIEAKADVNATDKSGMSVLDRTFNPEISDMLKAAGAKEKAPGPSLNF